MKRIFFAALSLGMILNVAAASAQGYPFGSDTTDQPWSVNQQTTPERIGAGHTTDRPRLVDQQTAAGSHRDGAPQPQTSVAASEAAR